MARALFTPAARRPQVIGVLITTGKNPGSSSKAIARALCASVPGSLLEFRGKRTLSALVAKARKLHFTRLCTIYSQDGKPSSISFLAIGDNGKWERLKPEIRIGKAHCRPLRKPKPSCSLEIRGPKEKQLRMLLSPANEPECEPESSISAGARTLSISLGRSKLLTLGVKYEG